jgi:hypothetical protein
LRFFTDSSLFSRFLHFDHLFVNRQVACSQINRGGWIKLMLLKKGKLLFNIASSVRLVPTSATLHFASAACRPIRAGQEARQARERNKFLAIVCTDNPYEKVRQPTEGTCEQFAFEDVNLSIATTAPGRGRRKAARRFIPIEYTLTDQNRNQI